MRVTKQKAAILECLSGRTDHPEAETLYLELRKKLPRISLGTVYRTLDRLCEKGLIRKLSYGDKPNRYDPDTSPHGHFTCTKCGAFFDVFGLESKMNALSEQLEVQNRWMIRTRVLDFYGLCGQCAGEKETAVLES